jgi:hypothetical protein
MEDRRFGYNTSELEMVKKNVISALQTLTQISQQEHEVSQLNHIDGILCDLINELVASDNRRF